MKIEYFNFCLLSKSVFKRLASGSFWSLVNSASTSVLGLMSGIVLARILGRDSFGELGVIQSSVLMFQNVAVCGIGITCSKHVSEYKLINKKLAGNIVSFSYVFSLMSGLSISLLFYFMSDIISTSILARPEISSVLKISSVLLFLRTIDSTQLGTLIGLESFKSQALFSLLFGIILFALSVFGAEYGGVFGVVVALVFTLFVQVLVNFYLVKHNLKKFSIKITFEDCKNQLHLIYKFNIPAMMSGLFQWGAVWGGNAILVNQVSGYSQAGLYNAAYLWFSVLIFLPSILNNAFFPILSERKGAVDVASFKGIFSIALCASILLTLPAAILVIVFKDFFIILYSNEFNELGSLVSILAIAAIFASPHNLISNTLISLDKMWLVFCSNMAWAFSYLFYSYIFCLNGYGSFSLAYGLLISYILRFLIMTLFLVKHINIFLAKSATARD